MLAKSVDDQLTRWKAILATDLQAYGDAVKQQEIPVLIPKPPSEAR
jgi:hypothetical protein